MAADPGGEEQAELAAGETPEAEDRAAGYPERDRRRQDRPKYASLSSLLLLLLPSSNPLLVGSALFSTGQNLLRWTTIGPDFGRSKSVPIRFVAYLPI